MTGQTEEKKEASALERLIEDFNYELNVLYDHTQGLDKGLQKIKHYYEDEVQDCDECPTPISSTLSHFDKLIFALDALRSRNKSLGISVRHINTIS